MFLSEHVWLGNSERTDLHRQYVEKKINNPLDLQMRELLFNILEDGGLGGGFQFHQAICKPQVHAQLKMKN